MVDTLATVSIHTWTLQRTHSGVQTIVGEAGGLHPNIAYTVYHIARAAVNSRAVAKWFIDGIYGYGYNIGQMSKKDAKELGETLSGGFIQHQATSHCSGEGMKVENPRARDLSEANPPHPRPWTKLPRNRKTKIALMGIGRNILDKADPRYKRALLLANSYRKVRSAELANMHGCISSGASALLSSASLALAASRFLYEKVAETGDISLLKQAASLGDSARQAELAAWEMSAREGAAKRRVDAMSAGVPWLEPVSDRSKPGRKTNLQRQQMAIDMVPELPAKREMTIDDVMVMPLPEEPGATP